MGLGAGKPNSGFAVFEFVTIVCTSQDSQGLIVNREKVDVKFLAYLLQVEVQKFKEIGKGVTIQGVTKKDLEELQIPLPPLSVQAEIVAEIELEEQKIIEFEKKILESKESIKRKVESVWQ